MLVVAESHKTSRLPRPSLWNQVLGLELCSLELFDDFLLRRWEPQGQGGIRAGTAPHTPSVFALGHSVVLHQ